MRERPPKLPNAMIPGVRFIPSSEFRRQPQPFYIDYAKAVEVGAALVRPAYEHRRAVFVSSFGFAGTGKSSFGEPLCWRLNHEGVAFSMLFIDSLKVAGQPPRAARDQLDHVRDTYINDTRHYPLMIVIDEAEALAPDRREHPSEALLCFWTMGLLKQVREAGLPAVVVACSNHPDHCDQTIDNEINSCIYFPQVTAEALVKLCERRKVSGGTSVVTEYMSLCRGGHVPIMRPFLNALVDVDHHTDVAWKKSPKKLGRLLWDFSNCPSQMQFGNYEHALSARIGRATGLRRFLLHEVSGKGAV